LFLGFFSEAVLITEIIYHQMRNGKIIMNAELKVTWKTIMSS